MFSEKLVLCIIWDERCWNSITILRSTDDKISQFLYLYLPIVVIMCCNATFFQSTARHIRKQQSEIDAVVKHDAASAASGGNLHHKHRVANEQHEQLSGQVDGTF